MISHVHDRALGAGRWARPLGVLTAALLPAVVWILVVGAGGVDVKVPESFGSETREDLELGAVIGASAIASLLGWAFLALLERVTARALTIWTVVALAVLVFSMPWSTGFTTTDRLVIAAMHLALGVVLIGTMHVTSRPLTARNAGG